MLKDESELRKSLPTTPNEQKATKAPCVHCGLDCPDDSVALGRHLFCCRGCRAVYRLLNESGLQGYYRETETPGTRPRLERLGSRFGFLDDHNLQQKLIDFSDGHVTRLRLKLPQMHCSSCLWLLENLYRINQGILSSRANFGRKELSLTFDQEVISLRGVVELLTRLGYEPELRLDATDVPGTNPRRRLYTQLGVAGFCFANIMLLSFPEYLAGRGISDGSLSTLLRHLNLLLALPVIGYSGADYFRSAVAGLQRRYLNIDVPIALGMLVLFGRSVYDILVGLGPGYLDSLAGLTFFLLLGKLFQRRTYDRLSFDRDYRAYFPLAVTVRRSSEESTIPVAELAVGDRMIVRGGEIIAADAVLMTGQATIDYSFVTGESAPQTAQPGDHVFAGGRQTGGAIELEMVKEVSQSYLTGLWNNAVFKEDRRGKVATTADRVARHFTAAVLTLAAATAVYWSLTDPARAATAVTAVLIVACPCALALSAPFVFGTAWRLMRSRGVFVRDPEVVESLASIDSVIFDKTGTLTEPEGEIRFKGEPMSEAERGLVASLARNSTHPVSRQLQSLARPADPASITDFVEEPGLGVAAVINGRRIRLGSAAWVGADTAAEFVQGGESGAWVAIDSIVRGQFVVGSRYRDGLNDMVDKLRRRYRLAILSGDSDREKSRLQGLFGDSATMAFRQSPHDKLAFVQQMVRKGRRPLMVGDGLNDGGALRAATVGLAVSEDKAAFFPASDGLVEAAQLKHLPRIMDLSLRSMRVVYASFAISLIYNVVGLTYAVSGQLSPVVSAILMPVSSISVVLFATVATVRQARSAGVK
ncbi:MAG: heavy metal translocating P-type ATPase metal-binding domain-containing protein [bacterium]